LRSFAIDESQALWSAFIALAYPYAKMTKYDFLGGEALTTDVSG
jgi:hypothetical protein